jgi:hypothetical protein
MNSRLYRVIAGFLCAFVIISVAPRAPRLIEAAGSSTLWPAAGAMLAALPQQATDRFTVMIAGISLPQIVVLPGMPPFLVEREGNLPLALAAGLTLVLVVSVTRRHVVQRREAPATTARHARGLAVARASDRIVARPRKDDSLGARIRQAALQGERSSALARRFGLSQDAIRVATGRRPTMSTTVGDKKLRHRPRASVVLPAAPATRLKSVAARGNG